ncbi:TIGR03826 family flagellar region protein [Virgibacillus ndiopensis]|uniref:TIGR03826 family flagellar region protein n=1 Tax=Virgibacillus ndiopensis TaxID=2004408 RepID=UPI000C072E38|nr:TIGR03826 family flagellar region protein [Virgibacillus ndiopensis]
MAELANCNRCDAVFVKSIRDICQNCYREEENAFERVYSFLRQRKNREATLMEIVEATEVEEDLIIKFIKEKRLRTSQFPKLAYPCEQCGKNITSGKLCSTCSQDLLNDLEKHEQIEKRVNEHKEKDKETHIYYSIEKRKDKF